MSDIKVKDRPALVRRGAAIVNVDREAFMEYISRRSVEQQRNDTIKGLESQVEKLTSLVESLLEERNAKEQNKG